MRSVNKRLRKRRWRSSFPGYLVFGLALTTQLCLMAALLHGASVKQQFFFLKLGLVLSLTASVYLSLLMLLPHTGARPRLATTLLSWIVFLFDFLLDSLLF